MERKKLMEVKFEWDEEKDRINRQKHGISFETASYVFRDEYLKKIGICIVLLTAAFTSIERSVFEAAQLDGGFLLHCAVLPIFIINKGIKFSAAITFY